jgi:hypothetical protein
MRKPNEEHLMSEFCKTLLPDINWASYSLVNVESVSNAEQTKSIYKKRMIITIEETSEYPDTMDRHLWHIH